MAVLEVVDGVPERHPGPDEDWSTAKDFRIAVDDLGTLTHGTASKLPAPAIAKSLYQRRAAFSIIRLPSRGRVPPNNVLQRNACEGLMRSGRLPSVHTASGTRDRALRTR